MHLFVVRLSNRFMLQASLIIARLYAFIGGSVELFSNIGESVALTTVGGSVNRTVNCAQLVNLSTDFQIVKIDVSVRTATSTVQTKIVS